MPPNIKKPIINFPSMKCAILLDKIRGLRRMTKKEIPPFSPFVNYKKLSSSYKCYRYFIYWQLIFNKTKKREKNSKINKKRTRQYGTLLKMRLFYVKLSSAQNERQRGEWVQPISEITFLLKLNKVSKAGT